EPESGNPEDVTLAYSASGEADNYVLRFSNARFVELANLTLSATGTTHTRTLDVEGRMDDILVEGCVFNSPPATGSDVAQANIHLEPAMSENVVFAGNSISGGSYGILYRGSTNTSNRAPGVEIRDNTVLGAGHTGILLQRTETALVSGNTVGAPGEAGPGSAGILLDNCDGALRVTGNRSLGAAGHAMRIANCTATSGQPGLVANNFVASNGTEATLNSYRNSQFLFYHNNVSNGGSGAGFHHENNLNARVSNLRNNILRSETGYAIHVQHTGSFQSSDHNDLYTAGTNLGRWGNTNAPTLSDWQ
ncbi:right-handed parallel beta-helix repeat-containing protein, partial [Pleomorphovibrio marinus]|uniref:right-handed parallel beta-helix repeat-containing protein n=1 Tax=Pleomorphovibrio marinus TaxID=2164132 RepID=UPI0013005384